MPSSCPPCSLVVRAVHELARKEEKANDDTRVGRVDSSSLRAREEARSLFLLLFGDVIVLFFLFLFSFSSSSSSVASPLGLLSPGQCPSMSSFFFRISFRPFAIAHFVVGLFLRRRPLPAHRCSLPLGNVVSAVVVVAAVAVRSRSLLFGWDKKINKKSRSGRRRPFPPQL